MNTHLKCKCSILAVIVTIVTMSSCENYYKALTAKTSSLPETKNTIQELQQQERYFIIRSGYQAYFMKHLILSPDQTELHTILDPLPPKHELYLSHGLKGRMLYKQDQSVLTEVHLFISPDSTLKKGEYTLSLSGIKKIEVIAKDKAKTTSSYVIGTIGSVVGALLVAAIIIAATKSSCPFVSGFTGTGFELQGEIYGGAIYPQLARDDYMPLRLEPAANGNLQVQISNELKEKQYTDFADLEVITHEKDSKVLSDANGNLYPLKAMQSPVRAWTTNKQDVLPALLKNDDQLLHFDDTLALHAENYVITEFTKPREAQNAKLVLSIKNSYWLDYLYGELAKGFGSYYTKYVKKQYKTPVEILNKWTNDQKLPLTVSIRTKGGWQKVSDIMTIGPLATRQVVVPLNLKDITDQTIQIKLSSGFMFWEIDCAAIDYSEDAQFEVATVSPFAAIDENGKNVLPELQQKDGIYLEQPVPGNLVTLSYKATPQPPNTDRSYILHTRGYYIHVRDYKGSPRTAFLKQFRKPNAFPAFSLERYKAFRNNSMASLANR